MCFVRVVVFFELFISCLLSCSLPEIRCLISRSRHCAIVVKIWSCRRSTTARDKIQRSQKQIRNIVRKTENEVWQFNQSTKKKLQFICWEHKISWEKIEFMSKHWQKKLYFDWVQFSSWFRRMNHHAFDWALIRVYTKRLRNNSTVLRLRFRKSVIDKHATQDLIIKIVLTMCEISCQWRHHLLCLILTKRSITIVLRLTLRVWKWVRSSSLCARHFDWTMLIESRVLKCCSCSHWRSVVAIALSTNSEELATWRYAAWCAARCEICLPISSNENIVLKRKTNIRFSCQRKNNYEYLHLSSQPVKLLSSSQRSLSSYSLGPYRSWNWPWTFVATARVLIVEELLATRHIDCMSITARSIILVGISAILGESCFVLRIDDFSSRGEEFSNSNSNSFEYIFQLFFISYTFFWGFLCHFFGLVRTIEQRRTYRSCYVLLCVRCSRI